MPIDQSEWDILKIYLAKDQQGTSHNLQIACKYFQSTKEGDKLQALLLRVNELNAEEFDCYIKQMGENLPSTI